MPIDATRLNALLDEQDAQQARQSGLAAPAVAPDQMARALQLADKRGAPPLAVAENLSEIEADEQLSALADASPHLGDWLTPEHAALARDDLGPLTKLAQAMRQTNASLTGLLGFVSPQGFQALNAVRRGVERSRFAEQANTGIMAAAAGLTETGADVLDMPQQGLRGILEGFGVTDRDVLDPLGTQRAGETAAAVGQEVRREQQAIGQQVGGRPTVAQIRQNPAAALEQGIAHYLGLGGQSAPLFGVALATRSPALGSSILAGTTGAQEYSGLKAQGVGRLEAAQGAVLTAAVESQFERIGLEALLGRWKGSLLASPFVEGGTEALTSLAQTNISDQATGEQTPIGEQLSQAFDAGVVGTGMGAPIALARAAVQAGPQPAAERDDLQSLGRLAASVEAAGRLEAITAAAAEAKTGKRHPVALEGLAPDETVYLPAEAVRTLFQEGDAVAFAEALTGNAAALDEAGEHGDLAVPMAKWLSVVAQLPNAAEFARHARTDIDGHSRADLEASLDLDFTDTSEAAERATPESQTSQQRVEQDVLGMLMASDRYRPADAELQAKFMGRVFRVMGERAGIDGWELYSRYKLRINGRGGRQGSRLDPRTEALIQSVRTGRIPEGREVFGPSLLDVLRGYNKDESGREVFGLRDDGGELRGMDAGKQAVGLINKNGLDLDTALEMLVEAEYLPANATISDLLEAIRSELMGQPIFSAANTDAKREAFRNEALGLSEAFDEAFRDVPRAELDAMTNQQIFDRLMGASERSVFGRALDAVRSLFQPARSDTVAREGGAHENAEQDLQSRLAQWSSSLHVGGGGPRAVAADAESIGAVARGPDGAAEQGDESREALREQSGRLIERAKAAGYFWPDDSPIVAALNALPANLKGGGAEHVAFIVGEGDNRLVIRATDNGYFGHRADISPAQYLARLDDYSSTFPRLQTRLIGVSESPEVEGHAVIWTAQPFVYGQKFGSQAALAEAFAAHGWKEDGTPGTPRFVHEATGAVIEDAHTDNVFQDENGDLYPFDVVVEKLPARTLYQSADPTDTPAFRRWFGDSKVVDADGRPLVVYHGAPDARFMDGDATFMSLHDRYGEKQGVGAFWFSRDRATATSYADDRRAFDYQNAEPSVIPAYLRMENPLIIDANGQDWMTAQSRGRTSNVIAEAQAAGHDGVIIRNVVDHYQNGGPNRPKPTGTFTVFNSRQIKPADRNRGTFDPDNPSILFQPADGGTGPRGSLDIGADRSMSINLFAGANLSTFVHESGHFFLEVMADVAADPNAPQAVKDDWAAILAYLGNDGGEITTEQHETWARSFEAYLMEGQAPAPELVGAFARMRAWLTSIYKALSALRVNLTPEVRSVMDRMIATDEEIEAAQVRQGMVPLELAPESRALVSDAQWQQYVAALQAGTEEARAEVFAKLAAAHKRAAEAWYREEKARVREEVEAELEALPIVRAWRILRGQGARLLPREAMESAPVGARVAGPDVPGVGPTEFEIREVPLDQLHLPELDAAGELVPEKRGDLAGYTARAKAGEQPPNLRGFLLDDGRVKIVDGHRRALAAKAAGKATVRVAVGVPPLPLRGLKLDRDAIAALFDDADTGKRMLVRLRSMYRRDGGASPDTAAAALGFTSGHELVTKLAGVPDLLAQIDAETTARMNERHPDPLLDGSLPETAMAAVHNVKRVQAMEAELGLLATLAQQPRPNARAIRAFALRTIAAKTIRAIQPNRYLAAERKAAREATKAAAQGDYAAALQAKREQVLQAALYREALAAQERAEKQIAALRKAGTDKTRERIGKAGKSYVDALDDLLEGHELRPVSARAVARRASLRAWVAQQQEADNHTAVGEELLARVERENVVNVLDLTGDQLAELHEAVKNLLHLASVKNRLQTRRGKIDWEEAKELLRDRLAEQDGKGRGISAADRSVLEGLQDLGAAGANWLLQPETVVEWLDDGVDGPWHDLLWEPSEEAEHTREALQREVGAKLLEAFGRLSKDERKALDRRVYIASLGESVSGHTILSALLNMGTASNRDKLLRGGRVNGDETTAFTPEQLAEMFGHLSGAHAELVQGIWDAVHTLWPHVVALEVELNGITPEKIEAEAVTIVTRDGPVALRGGYFPAVYDPRGAKVGRMAEDEQAKRVLSGGLPIKASTSRGHIEKRTDYVAPLLLDYHAVLARHLDGVMSDLAYRKFLKQAYRILDDADLARMIDNRVGMNATKILKSGMERGAVGSFSLAGPLFGPFQGLADAGMTNLSAAALGLRVPLALANTITAPILATARVGARYVAEGFATYYRNPKAGARMVQQLSPMMLRRAEARTVEWRSMLDNLRGKRGLRKQMIEFTMSVHQWIVPLAENAIWIGAYREALAGGQEAAEAIRLADKAIRQSQTKHTAKDLSLAEGSPYLRWAMMFAGPLAVINNRLQEAGLRGLRGAVNSPIQALATWGAMAAGGVWVFELLMGRGPGDEDDDGDEDIADWAKWCAVKLGLLPFAAYPILRDIGSAIDSGFSRNNPLVDAGMSLWRFGKTVWNSGEALFDGDDVDEAKLAKDTARAVGTVTGLPSGQAVRSGTYFMEVATGQHTPANPAAEAVYLLQGPPKE